METKQMYLANFNVTFGTKDSPLLEWLDEFVLPALNKGYKRELNKRTKIMFEDVKIEDIGDNEYVLRGVIIKDTILDIYNEYDDKNGLVDVEHHHKSAPYSTFVIYLKNHRMVLVRKQSGSPGLKVFASTVTDILRMYRREENKKRRNEGKEYLPNAIISVKGITSQTSINEFMKKVKKVKSVTFILKPKNNEKGGLYGLLDEIDDKIRKKSESKCAKVVVSSPGSMSAVASLINSVDGLIQTEMDVEYLNEEFDEEANKLKKTGKIRDNEISQIVDVSIHSELRDSFGDVYSHCKSMSQLNVETDNIVSYRDFLERRKQNE